MIKVTAQIKKSGGGLLDLAKATNYLRDRQVVVGYAEGSGNHGEINNAQLAFIHSNGSPKKGIPARPIIEPALEQPDARERIPELLREAVAASLDGNISGINAALERAGIYGANTVKEWFNGNNGWPPLKDPYRTIGVEIDKYGERKTGKDGTPKYIHKNKSGGGKPLLDTGQLRQSVTYAVKEK
jgi:hypothetical protein